MWEKIDVMFPRGGITLENKYYTNQEIANSDLNQIISYIHKPVRQMKEKEIKYTYYANGNLDVRTTYNVFPPKMVDNISLLNVYGQKILNDILRDDYD